MALPDVAATLGKEFVDVRIDIDRMDGGAKRSSNASTFRARGIPWFAFIGRKGKAIATNDGPNGNIGYPYEDHEIAHFMKMLGAAPRHLTQPEHERLEESLKARKKVEKL